MVREEPQPHRRLQEATSLNEEGDDPAAGGLAGHFPVPKQMWLNRSAQDGSLLTANNESVSMTMSFLLSQVPQGDVLSPDGGYVCSALYPRWETQDQGLSIFYNKQ